MKNFCKSSLTLKSENLTKNQFEYTAFIQKVDPGTTLSGLCLGHRLPGDQGMGNDGGSPGMAEPIPPPQPGAGQTEGMVQSQPWASGTDLGMARGWAKVWACG